MLVSSGVPGRMRITTAVGSETVHRVPSSRHPFLSPRLSPQGGFHRTARNNLPLRSAPSLAPASPFGLYLVPHFAAVIPSSRIATLWARPAARRRPQLPSRRCAVASAAAVPSSEASASAPQSQPKPHHGGPSIDVVTLGNLCVDVIRSVDVLPPHGRVKKRAYLENLQVIAFGRG